MTLLSLIDNFVIQSATSVNTTSSTLSDDTQAIKNDLVLTKKEVILAIYIANSNHGSINTVDGIHTAISINGTDYGDTYQTPGLVNCCLRSVSFWVGTLEAGTHEIKGRFASNTDTNTSTIDNRTLIIYVFEGDEFYYYANTSSQGTTSLNYIDDNFGYYSCTPSGSGKALILYGVTNTNNTNSSTTGTNICINVDDVDYIGSKACQSSYAGSKALSVTTAYALPIYNKYTTFKGRFASYYNRSAAIKSISYLAVLCFDDSTLLDVSFNINSIRNDTTDLINDTTTNIDRTISSTYNLLTFGQATRNYINGITLPMSYNGAKYGLQIIDDEISTDVVFSKTSTSSYQAPYSNFVGYGVDANGHITINGRLACNYDSGGIIDTRILIALWFVITKDFISGSGSGKGDSSAYTETLYVVDVDFVANPSEGNKPLDVKFTNISYLDAGNIIQNGSSEITLPLSTTNSNTIVAESSFVATKGMYSMSVLATSSSGNCWIGVNDSILQLTKGQSYYWECRVYTSNATKVNVSEMGLQEVRGTQRIVATGEINSNTGLQSLPENTWTKICGVGIIPNDFGGGFDNYRLLLRPARINETTYDTATTLYYDNIIVIPASFAWDFGDSIYGTNLVTNSSVEGTLPGYTTVTSSTAVLDTVYKRTGSYSMKVKAVSTNIDSHINISSSFQSEGFNCILLELDTEYYWEAYIYSPVTVKFHPNRCYLQSQGMPEAQALAKGTIFGSGDIQTLPANTWVKLSGQCKTPTSWGTNNDRFVLILRPAFTDETHFDVTNYLYYDDFKFSTVHSTQAVNEYTYGNNILTDPSVETSLPVSITVNASTVLRDSEFSHSGTYSLKIIAIYSSDATYNCSAYLWCSHLPMDINTNYYWEVYIFSPIGFNFYPKRCYIGELNRPEAQNIAYGKINNSEDLQTLPANTWVKLYGYGTTPSDWGSKNTHFHLVIRPVFIDSGNYDTSKYLYYDDFKVCTYEEIQVYHPATTINAEHIYENIGQYTPSLTVTTPTGVYTRTYENLIHVMEPISFTSSVSGGNGTVLALMKRISFLKSNISGGNGSCVATCLNQNSLHCNIIGHGTNNNVIWLIKRCTISSSGSGSSKAYTFRNLKITGSATGEAGQQTAIIGKFLKIRSSVSGSGSSLNRLDNINVSISGHGTYTVHVNRYYHISASSIGHGNSLVIIDRYSHINSNVSGSGSSVSSIRSTNYLNGAEEGTGTYLAEITSSCHINASNSGIGSYLVSIIEIYHIKASKSGIGSYLANIGRKCEISGSGSGAGTCSCIINIIDMLLGTGSGSGENTAYLTMTYYISGSGSGEGSDTNTIYEIYYINSSVMGTGYETALIRSIVYIFSSVSGSGSSNNNLDLLCYVNGSGSGNGSYIALIDRSIYIDSSVSGSGSNTNLIKFYDHLHSNLRGKGKQRGACFKVIDSNERVKVFPVEIFPPYFFPLELFWSVYVVQINVEELSYSIKLDFVSMECEIIQSKYEVE